jgi:hypothetical protein
MIERETALLPYLSSAFPPPPPFSLAEILQKVKGNPCLKGKPLVTKPEIVEVIQDFKSWWI